MNEAPALPAGTLRVRPARADDLPALATLLGRRAALPAAPDETLLVAAHEPSEGEIATPIAMLRLLPAIGLALPRVWYHVGCAVHAAPELQRMHRQRTLLLGHDHTGASELADVAWDRGMPLAAQAAALRLVVQAALLRVARRRAAYAQEIVATLPGLRDASGQSPFWAGLGRHFYPGDPAAAAAAHGPDWRSHVAALLPRQLVYASFLPEAAQAAIGQAATEALLLREVLEEAGLRYAHHVDVEDAGPVLAAATDDLAAPRLARRWRVAPSLEPGGEVLAVLREAPGEDWHAALLHGRLGGGRLACAAAAAQRAGLAPGDEVWAVPLHAAAAAPADAAPPVR